MTDWQPIETAPKDETWVLLAGGTAEYRWDGDMPPPMVVGQFSLWSNGRVSTEGRWHFAWYDGGFMGEYENPTHWHPLPSLPDKDA